jgi:SAM-dependent methyltransferase
MTEHTGASYDAIASKCAQTVDTKPWNAYYERPAVISLLPSLGNIKVLDVGCGSGWYAEYLVAHGAEVTAFDLNAEFVAITRARVGASAKVLQADLAQTLDFACDEEFDLVVCPLVLHYLKAWRPVFIELRRVLKPHGILVSSTHHPFMDWKLYNREDYCMQEKLEDEWEDIGKGQYYRRPLTALSDDLDAAGFYIERLLEPQPTEAFRCVNLEDYERLMKNPWFLVVRARKKG